MKKTILFFLIVILALGNGKGMADEEVLTEKEAAIFLKLPVETINSLVRNGQLPAQEVEKGKFRFSKQSLLSWLNNPEYLSNQHAEKTEDTKKIASSSVEKDDRSPSDDIESVLFRDRAALNPSGKFSIETGVTYTKQETQMMLPDAPSLISFEQKYLTSAFTIRYGLDNGFQFMTSIPYQYSSEKISAGSLSIHNNSKSCFGDAIIGVQKLLFAEGTGYPGMILGLSGTLGEEHLFSVDCNLSKTVDPAILFMILQYTNHINSTDSQSPVNQIDCQFGFGLKINEDLMAQVALLVDYGDEVRSEGITIPGEDNFWTNFGLNWRIAKNVFFEPHVQSLLTGNRSDVTIGASMVYTY